MLYSFTDDIKNPLSFLKLKTSVFYWAKALLGKITFPWYMDEENHRTLAGSPFTTFFFHERGYRTGILCPFSSLRKGFLTSH